MGITLSPPFSAEKHTNDKQHWTVDAFYKAYEVGQFGFDKRLELIQGRIVEKMPPGPYHSALADIIAQMLRDAMQPSFIVREEKVIHLATDSELMPDIMVAQGARTDYLERHPTSKEVVLLVEVADTTVARDLGEKAMLYSQSGVTDYWVVLVNEAVIVRHRVPSDEGYKEVTRLTGNDAISPLAAPEIAWMVETLIGREEAPEGN